jgi:hypothetical protein
MSHLAVRILLQSNLICVASLGLPRYAGACIKHVSDIAGESLE